MAVSEDITTITVHKTTWTRLNRLKQPGESFDELINRVLDEFPDAE